MASSAKANRRSSKDSPDVNELLVLELQEIHNAENQLARVLPRLGKAADSQKLGRLLEQRLEQGERLIKDIESTLDELQESPGRKKNVAAEGLINDAREHVQEIEQGPALDTALIGAIQKTEHYCIAAWGTAKALAQAVGQKTATRAMERALKEGASLDEQLTELAEREITPALLSGATEDEDSQGSDGARSNAQRSGKSEQRAGR